MRADEAQTGSSSAAVAVLDRPWWLPPRPPRVALHRAWSRLRVGLARGGNWLQLVKFGVVGATGYVVNLAAYASLLHAAGLHFRLAAVLSFLVAVTNNYVLNRAWTFRDARGHVGFQGARFLAVSTVVLGVNIAVLSTLVAFDMGKVPAQAAAIVLVMPLNFLGNKLWSFR